MTPKESNNPEAGVDVERFWAGRNAGRARTILYSVVASGLVALVIGRAVEVEVYNAQRDRSVKNCELIQDDRRLAARQLERSADRTLGNPEEGIEPLKIEGTAFEGIKPLIIGLAQERRMQAREYRSRIQNCEEVFPPQDIFDIPFIE